MRKFLWLIQLLAAGAVFLSGCTTPGAERPAPSPVGEWAVFACGRTGKSRMQTSLTVFADGRYESRTPEGTTVEIERGTWRQDGADVYFAEAGEEFRTRFDNAGRLVPDGQDRLHQYGCKLVLERRPERKP